MKRILMSIFTFVLISSILVSSMTTCAFATTSVEKKKDEREQAVESVVKEFLSSEYAYFSGKDSTSFLDYLAPRYTESKNILFHLSYLDYQVAVLNLLGWEIIEDDLSFSDIKVDVQSNRADASIVTKYKYFASDGFNKERFRSKTYYFNLEFQNGRWLISDIKTSDPWELEDDFIYEPIDVDGAISQLKNDISAQNNDTINSPIMNEFTNVQSELRGLYYWAYDVDSAVSYAEQYYSSYNSMFPSFIGQGGDCQNFASQCVWAGLGGTLSTTGIPAVSTTLVGSNSPRVWCCGQYTTYYNGINTYYNWAWTRCEGFLKLIATSDNITIGPRGWTWYGTLANAQPGCVIHFDRDSNPTIDTMDHAMFVTDANGTIGNRTVSNLFIAAHTTDTTSACQSLALYAPALLSSDYSTTYILCGQYATQQ